MMRAFLFLLLPLTVFAWEKNFSNWVFSEAGSVLVKCNATELYTAQPDIGLLNTFKVLKSLSYCSESKPFFYTYKIPYETAIPVAVLRCSEKTFIAVDRELGLVSYLYLENSERVFFPKTETLNKAETSFEEVKGGYYYLPYYTYVLKENKKRIKSLTPIEMR